jgi:acetyltransferase-like isoleucine patch superfamily enzyme
MGVFADQPGIKRSEEYFKSHDTFLDCRGYGMIDFHETAELGWNVKMFTLSHDSYRFGDLVKRPIKIEKGAFVASFATLYNCKIGEGAIVALETVVRSRIVPPFTMVEGNPARIFRKLVNREWVEYHAELEKMGR